MAKTAAARPDLSRAAIVDRALDIADAEGRDALTIRRLAQEFGVTPMALYWHVRNKQELLVAMGQRFFDQLPAWSVDPARPPAPSAPPADLPAWLGELRALLAALIDALRPHPASAYLAPSQTLQCEPGRELTERALQLLSAQGFSAEQGADIARTAMQLVVMLVTGSTVDDELDVPVAQRGGLREAKRAAVSALPADRYPHMVASARGLTECLDDDEYYDFGLDLFIGGVQQLHRRLTAAGSPAKPSRTRATPGARLKVQRAESVS